MGTFSCNTNRLINEVKPTLYLAQTNLEASINIISKINIPSDFSYNINGISGEISGINESIQGMLGWIDFEVTKILETENNNEKLVQLVMGDLEYRKSLTNFLEIKDKEVTGGELMNLEETEDENKSILDMLNFSLEMLSGIHIQEAKANLEMYDINNLKESVLGIIDKVGTQYIPNVIEFFYQKGNDIGIQIEEFINNIGKDNIEVTSELEEEDVPVLQALKSEISVRNTTNIANMILENAQIFQSRQHEGEWVYSQKGLIYHGDGSTTFEHVINNENKKLCCATFVSCVLYSSGVITKEEFIDASNERKFNPNYVANVNSVLDKKGCEKIEEIDYLQPGDIVIEGVSMEHIMIFAGYDDDGNMLFYSAGSTNEVQSPGPVQRELNKVWWAYRVDDDATSVEPEPKEFTI